MRVLVGSLVGNAVYTRLGYRRAFPPALPALEEAIGSARLDGHFTGEPPAAANIAAMVEQVAMMMMLDRAFHPPAVPLRGRRRCIAVRCDSLLRSGIGFAPESVEQELIDRETRTMRSQLTARISKPLWVSMRLCVL